MTLPRLRVLFLCTHNAARSQMAEALMHQLSQGAVDVFSAGTEPAADVHPMTKLVLERRFGIDPSSLYPKSLDRFLNEGWDFIITVCDRAAESCPVFPDDPEKIHWGFEDPALITDIESQRRAFEHVAGGLAARIRIWMALPEIRRRIESALATGVE